MVAEGFVLLRVKHLQEGAGGIPSKIGAELVNLVEHEDGVDRADAVHALDDSSRQRPDVGPAMPPDFRFVADPPERYPGEFSVGRPCNGAAQGGLTDAGGADQAKDRAFGLSDQAANRQVFQDPLLHFFQAMMIFFEHGLGVSEIEILSGPLGPGKIHQPIQVIPDHGALGRHRGHGFKTADFFFRFLHHRGGHLGLADLLAELFHLGA